MLKKDQRFSFKDELPKKIISSPLFVLRYQKNNDSEIKCAVVVSKRVDKRAVARNRLKRIFLNIIEDISKNKAMPFNMVFFLKKEVLGKEQNYIKKEIEKILTQVKI